MNFPSAPQTTVSRIEYTISVSGEEGGATTFVFDAIQSSSQIGVSVEQLAARYQAFMLAVKSDAVANKPAGSTVTMTRQYIGSSNLDVPL